MQEQFKIELVRRDSKPSKRKFSADHRYRERTRDRACTPSITTDKLRQTISHEKEKSGCLNTIFRKELEERSFAQKCMSFLAKKKLVQKQQNECQRSNNFNTMLQNIKNVIKERQKKGRELKIEAEPLVNNEFQCIRSQIHQIYSNEEKVELYRMIKNSQAKLTTQKEKASNKAQTIEPLTTQTKPLHNPFFNLKTVVCFTMALNDPSQPKRQNFFEAPVPRTSMSAWNNRRTVSISKPSQARSMAFSLSSDGDGQYWKKLKNFFDFLFKVNYSNNIYVSLQISKPQEMINNPTRYKVYIGKGNNSLLVKSLMKRRFWWDITDSFQTTGIHFYWSQNIIDKIEALQLKATPESVAIPEKSLRKRKELEESYDLNRKILSVEKAKKIERFITKQGFIIPFEETFNPDILSNHLPRNYCIGSKKNLFKSLFHYFTRVKHKNPFDYIPKTYHIRSLEDQDYLAFVKENEIQPDKVWIVKPGENTNRGRGIKLSSFRNISQLIKKTKHENGQPFTYIVQSYINKPFLYNHRKFDIRHFMMLTSVNGILKAYWYKEGYIRTSSEIFDLEELDNEFIHLTNDAIQRNSEDYQKFQPANKLSYSEFQRYLDYTFPSKNYNFEKDILPKIKEIASYIVKANYRTIDHRRHQNNFEIFGLDFMIDRDFKPWLIEVNYNPCLEVNCPVLQRIIPVMLQNSLRIGLDPLFPPSGHYPVSKRFYLSDNYLKNLKYELIFDEDSLRSPIPNDYDFVDEKQQEQQYQDEGQEVNELLV